MPTKSVESKPKLSQIQMDEIQNLCEPIVEYFKQQYVKSGPDKSYSYLTDVYTKWYRHYLYFCEKYKNENTNGILNEYKSKFVRLEYTAGNKFNFSYFRHTGQWFTVATDMPLNDCFEMMRDNPNFQPIG